MIKGKNFLRRGIFRTHNAGLQTNLVFFENRSTRRIHAYIILIIVGIPQPSANNHNYVNENLDRIKRDDGVIARFIIYALPHIVDRFTIIEIHYSSGG